MSGAFRAPRESALGTVGLSQNSHQPLPEPSAQLLRLVPFGHLRQKDDYHFQDHPTGHLFDLPRRACPGLQRTGEPTEGRRPDTNPPLARVITGRWYRARWAYTIDPGVHMPGFCASSRGSTLGTAAESGKKLSGADEPVVVLEPRRRAAPGGYGCSTPVGPALQTSTSRAETLMGTRG